MRLCSAYSDVMKIMLIAATVLAVVPLVLACFMPNWYLGDRQNAVDAADLKGERVVNPGQASSSQQPPVEQEPVGGSSRTSMRRDSQPKKLTSRLSGVYLEAHKI